MSGGIVHAPIQCVFQADTLICKAVKSKICDLVFANDTDFGFLTGGKILQVSSFKVIGRNPLLKTLHGITISSPCYELMKKFKKSVPEKKLNINKAKYPLLDLIPPKHHMVRALLATAIGCDTCPDGIKGIGPSTATKFTNDLYSTKRLPNSKKSRIKSH